jgi:hypothetical protein
MNKKHYIKYIVKAIEIVVFFSILYIIYLLIWPSAKVIITPTYTLQDIVYNFRYYPHQSDIFAVEQDRLSIPYYEGAIEYTYQTKINVANITNAQEHAQGSVTLYNTTDIEYAIIAGTTFITDNGLLFKSKSKFTIPPKISDTTPGQVTIELKAADADISSQIMGEKGNIPKDTTLYIKNLKSSYFLKSIYAKANGEFVGGKTLSS